MGKSQPITMLARRWSAGDRTALDELIGRVHPELRAIAHRQLHGKRGGHTVSTTVLVNEAYLRLAGAEGADWTDRAHFFAFCAKVMRHILVDLARRKAAERRGGHLIRVTLTDDIACNESDALEILALDQALERIGARSSRMARIVECRFFGGMSVPETAEAIDTSPRTVEREWSRARAYLRYALHPQSD